MTRPNIKSVRFSDKALYMLERLSGRWGTSSNAVINRILESDDIQVVEQQVTRLTQDQSDNTHDPFWD